MKKFEYIADCGSIAIGNNNFISLFANGCGDGKFEVSINNKNNNDNNDERIFITVIECFKETNVYRHDCEPFNSIIYKLKAGRYGIYRHKNNGNMYIQLWKCYCKLQ